MFKDVASEYVQLATVPEQSSAGDSAGRDILRQAFRQQIAAAVKGMTRPGRRIHSVPRMRLYHQLVVWTGPARGTALYVTRVLVAVDETLESVHAAEVARSLFGDDAEYVAVNVAKVIPGAAPIWWSAAWHMRYPVPFGAAWPLGGVAQGYPPPADDLEREIPPTEAAMRAAEDTARTAVEESDLAGTEVVGEIGDPAEVITDIATDRSVDVIVVGTHDRSWFNRLLRHSVSKDVLEQSRAPVLVVPPSVDVSSP